MNEKPIRPGVLHHLVQKLGTPSRMKVQKLSYLLQEGLGAGTGYRFKMHHQGPVSDELANVTDWMRATGHLEMWNNPETQGYLIIVRLDAEEEWREAAAPEREKLDRLLEALGTRPDGYLELLASVHFVQKIQPDNTPKKTAQTVGAMKPKILPASIKAAYADLEELGTFQCFPTPNP